MCSQLSVTGRTLCGATATVVVRDGAFSSALEPTSDCLYVGPPERAGTYAVDVSAGAWTTTVSNVKVDETECGVVTRRLGISVDV